MGLVNLFLKTELTCIPGVLDRYFGKYYNNTLSNAATWLIVFWCVLHAAFDFFLNGLFKKMKYKQFLRERLQVSLWYLGFYSTALMYTGATLGRNSIELFRLKMGHSAHESAISGQSIVGFIVLLTFFIQSAIWESLKYGNVISFACHALFAMFLLLTQYLRAVEIAYSLVAILSLGQIALNLTICMDVLRSPKLHDSVMLNYLVKMMMFGSILIILGCYLVLVPVIVLPLAIKILTSFPNLLLYLCFITLLSFLAASLYQSVIHRLVMHWLNHTDPKKSCNITKCILYLPRNDEAYTLSTLRHEAKLRQQANLPSQKQKLIQTLRCFIAMKRKMRQQRSLQKEVPKGSTIKLIQDQASPSQSSDKVTEESDAQKNDLETDIQVFFAEEEPLEGESDTETLESVVALKRKIQERRLLEEDFVGSADSLLNQNDESASQSSVEITEALNDVMNDLENKNDEATLSEEKPLLVESDRESSESNDDSVMSQNNSDPDSTKDGLLEMQ